MRRSVIIIRSARYMESCPSWPKEHDWKSCKRLKRFEGSNPLLSAKEAGFLTCFFFFCLMPKRPKRSRINGFGHLHKSDDIRRIFLNSFEWSSNGPHFSNSKMYQKLRNINKKGMLKLRHSYANGPQFPQKGIIFPIYSLRKVSRPTHFSERIGIKTTLKYQLFIYSQHYNALISSENNLRQNKFG